MTSVYIFFVILALISLFIFKKSGSFFKALFSSLLGGVTSLCAVLVLGYFFPITLGVNTISLVVSALLSVPGVVMLLLLGCFC